MSRPRSSKEIASRIQPDYFHRTRGLRLWRRLLSILCAAGALAWWATGGAHGRARLYSPGHVAGVHAMWNNDCSRCHDNDGKGGFRLAVSDHACLQCHGAAAHHPNQLMRDGTNAVHALALAVNDAGGPPRSARCAECHVEHRGHAALAAADDANCTRCHANIAAAVKPGARASTANVTAFDLAGGHPHFRQSGQPWVDPIVLKFGHDKHGPDPRQVPPILANGENCGRCHTSAIEAKAQNAAGSHAFHPTPVSDRSGGRYMEPPLYTRTCQTGCHELRLPLNDPLGASLPHASLAVIRDQLADLPGLFRRSLQQMPEASRRQATQSQSDEQWVNKERDKLWDDLLEFVGAPAGEKVLDSKTRDAFNEAYGSKGEDRWPDPRVVEAYLAFGEQKNGCSKCHQVRREPGAPLQTSLASAAGTQPAAAESRPSSDAAPPARAESQPAAPATQPAPARLETVPTGLSPAPRRWYAGSRFDHAAHRNLTCVSCHADAPNSPTLANAMIPNDTWVAGGKAASCADCHHRSNSAGPGASTRCITCHGFHGGGGTQPPAHARSIADWTGPRARS